MTVKMEVGSVVRVPRDETKLTGRAVVATLYDDGTVACLLWEDLAPRPIIAQPFIVTPMMPRSKEEKECTRARSEISPLLDFEEKREKDESVEVWKERGDSLLRLGDASAAIPYYEAALAVSSVLQVGSTVLVSSQKDAFRVAEIDCLEDDNVDISMGDEEATIPATDVKLSFLPNHESLQVRILLNLTRCLMQVADLDGTTMAAYYRRSAAMACSMALAMLETLETNDTLQATALLLRSKACASRAKWALAMQDAKLLLSDHPQYKEGRMWMQRLEAQTARQKKTNQKLAKSMCQWVQTATTTGASDISGETKKETISQTSSVSSVTEKEKTSSISLKRSQSYSILWWQLLIPLLLGLWIHRMIFRYNSQDR